MQALWVLAFVLALRETTRNPSWRELPLRFVPAAVIAVGSVYTYSFPGLIWLAVILAAWLALERQLPVRPLLLALAVFAVGALPELGRMIDFHNFETFDPNGPGLGNLFGQVSPLTALGIWFSGDFRVAPGDGAVPAFAYYLGAAFAAVLLALGLRRCVRGRESAILGGAVAVALLYVAARIGGTPYTSAKALEIAAPILALSDRRAKALSQTPWLAKSALLGAAWAYSADCRLLLAAWLSPTLRSGRPATRRR